MSKVKAHAIRKYECPLEKKTFHFLKPSMYQQEYIDEQSLLKKEEVEYGGFTQLFCAAYLSLQCDSKGKATHENLITDTEYYQELVDQLMHEPGLWEHLKPSVEYAVHGKVIKDEDLLSDIEGSVEKAKK